MIMFMILIALMIRNEYKITESQILHSWHGKIMDNYTGVDFDPTPLSAHTIFRPTKG